MNFIFLLFFVAAERIFLYCLKAKPTVHNDQNGADLDRTAAKSLNPAECHFWNTDYSSYSSF